MPQRRGPIALIRVLRAFGPLRPPRQIPRQKQPDGIRADYYRAILPFVETADAAFAAVKPKVIELLRQERRMQGHADASNKEQAKKLIAEAAARASAAWRPSEIADAAKRYARRTSDFNKEQLGRQVQAAFSVPLSALEPQVTVRIEEFAAINVDLITSVSGRYFDRIRQDVEEAFDSGEHPDTLADTLEERTGMSENDARRIARDQIGKLNANLNQDRQERMGVTGYTWRTMQDERVREEHAILEGEHFEWDDPPEDGHPGEAIQCRCYAEPDFEPLLEGLGQGSEDDG